MKKKREIGEKPTAVEMKIEIIPVPSLTFTQRTL